MPGEFLRRYNSSWLRSNLAIRARKFFARARYQTAHVILFQGQRVRDFTIRKSLLTQQQTTAHRLFYFIERASRSFQLLRAVRLKLSRNFLARLLISGVTRQGPVASADRIS